jgi:hypothetical protein
MPFGKIFPNLRVGGTRWAANNNLLEFVDHQGSFRNTTVDGAINGFGLNLGVVDDPVKGSAEAANNFTSTCTVIKCELKRCCERITNLSETAGR